MLRDQSKTYSTGTSLFASWEEVEQVVLSFVDTYLPSFVTYYKYQGSPTAENRITDLLSVHFNTCHSGYLPFFFEKNATNRISRKRHRSFCERQEYDTNAPHL